MVRFSNKKNFFSKQREVYIVAMVLSTKLKENFCTTDVGNHCGRSTGIESVKRRRLTRRLGANGGGSQVANNHFPFRERQRDHKRARTLRGSRVGHLFHNQQLSNRRHCARQRLLTEMLDRKCSAGGL